MKLKLSFLLLLCPFFSVQAQVNITQKTNPALINGITVGQAVPGTFWLQTYGTDKSDKSLSAFKGKLLILDFWATWCAPCIAMNPKMEALQEQFSGQIQL